MEVLKEINEIIDNLKAKKKFKDVDHHKLDYLFNSAELDLPQSIANKEYDITAMRFDLKEKENSKTSIFSSLIDLKKWIPVPALMIIGIIIYSLFQTGIFSPHINTGSVYNIYGKVELERGSSIRILKTSDQIKYGDTILTAPNSHADLRFGNLIRLRVAKK